MTYRLTANVDDMGFTEAKAVTRAILERFGSSIVEEEMKRWSEDCRVEREPCDRPYDADEFIRRQQGLKA